MVEFNNMHFMLNSRNLIVDVFIHIHVKAFSVVTERDI